MNDTNLDALDTDGYTMADAERALAARQALMAGKITLSERDRRLAENQAGRAAFSELCNVLGMTEAEARQS